ncbi:hypothetical protein EDD15DRAFT_2200653 [Pisolithus albus]|nr:hypothetical protein EDD15DRAFT_2200653 [Pisolithus albus]
MSRSRCLRLTPQRAEGVSEIYIITRHHIYLCNVLAFSLGDQGHVHCKEQDEMMAQAKHSTYAQGYTLVHPLLAAEEGSVGISVGNSEADPDPPMGEFPYMGEAHAPLPRRRHNLQMNRDLQSQDQTPYVGGDGLYSGDEQFSYEGIPYHRSINPGWYDPSGRGSDIHYGTYHPQFILPPPFPPHRFPARGYANDPTIHWPHGARGSGHHAHAPLPFRGAHNISKSTL